MKKSVIVCWIVLLVMCFSCSCGASNTLENSKSEIVISDIGDVFPILNVPMEATEQEVAKVLGSPTISMPMSYTYNSYPISVEILGVESDSIMVSFNNESSYGSVGSFSAIMNFKGGKKNKKIYAEACNLAQSVYGDPMRSDENSYTYLVGKDTYLRVYCDDEQVNLEYGTDFYGIYK